MDPLGAIHYVKLLFLDVDVISAAVKPSPKSLIVDLLSTLPRSRRGSMPVSALVASARCFGIAENSVRVALARLRAAGTVDRDERGRYRLGERTEAIRREVASWKTRHEDVRNWSQRGWIGLLTSASERPSRRVTSRRQRALRLLGFRALEPHLHVRPDNLAGGVERARERLHALDPSLQASLVVGLKELDAAAEQRAIRLWSPDEAVAAYGHSLRRLCESEGRLASLTAEEAMVETFLLGGEVLRQIALDPLLPAEIVPAREREALVSKMRRYDEIGRRCWADFLGRFDVPHLRTPTDMRVAEAALAPV